VIREEWSGYQLNPPVHNKWAKPQPINRKKWDFQESEPCQLIQTEKGELDLTVRNFQEIEMIMDLHFVMATQ